MLGICLLLLAVGPSAVAQEAPLRGFDEYARQALKDWEVPGLAIAVVKDDAVVLAKGYGVRRLGEAAPVGERTLFAIGSASKAFTAASLAMLVDEGKVKWDDPATRHLAWLQLFDPYVTRELTVRDLLTHRSGLERADLLWYGSAYTREDILRRVRYLRPTWSLRSRYGYQNIMYLAAGQIVPALAGRSWDEFVRGRIFAPLGMTASNTSVTALQGREDVAAPHARIDGALRPIPWRNIDNIGPAGSINSNVAEMAQWVRLQLGEGSYQGKRLLSAAAVQEMHTPQTVIRREGIAEKLYPETRFMNYGLGWMLLDYRGRKVVQHGGNIDGMSALVAMIPEEKLGLVILTNRNRSSAHTALMYRVFDAYLRGPARDWSAELLRAVKAQQETERAREKKTEDERAEGTSPSLAPGRYAGLYQDDLYGEVTVAEEGGKLVVRYGPAFVGDLEHWHYDTFRATWRDRMLGRSFVTFALDARGRVAEATVQNLGDFKRAPEKEENRARANAGK